MSHSPPRKRQKVASGLEVFQHSALDTSKPHIRLVRFSPKGLDGMLRLDMLENVSLRRDACPEYRALSYEWGPPRPRRGILVDGKVFLIRKNLYQFLQSLLDHHGGVDLGYFWADAVCIDQENVDEKNHQVQQMKAIYQQALQVMVWLGPSVNVLDGEVFDFIKQLKYDDWLNARKFEVPAAVKARMYKDKARLLALYDLFCRPYWQRMWIVQELALAYDILLSCGCFSARWGHLEAAESVLFYQANPPYPVPKVLQQQSLAFQRLHMYIRYEEKPPSLLRAMVYFGESLCEIVHDRVYSLLGVTEDPSLLRVDYQLTLELLLLDVLELRSRDTGPEEYFALSTALSACFVIQQSTVTLSCQPAGQRSEPIAISIPPQPRGKGHFSVPCDTSLVLSHGLNRKLSSTFEWTLFDLASMTRGAYSEDVLRCYRSTLATKDNVCQCFLCARQGPVLVCPSQEQLPPTDVSQSVDILRVENSNRSAAIIRTRDFPEVFMIFQHTQYIATLLRGRAPKASAIFRDPLKSSWKVGQTYTTTHYKPHLIPITVTVASVLILLAHVYPKDGTLRSLR